MDKTKPSETTCICLHVRANAYAYVCARVHVVTIRCDVVRRTKKPKCNICNRYDARMTKLKSREGDLATDWKSLTDAEKKEFKEANKELETIALLEAMKARSFDFE